MTLDGELRAYDGGLAIVREFEGVWYLILQDGTTYPLPGVTTAAYLLQDCGSMRYGVVSCVNTEWRLTKAPVLTELQIQAVERALGDEMIAKLLEQAENGA